MILSRVWPILVAVSCALCAVAFAQAGEPGKAPGHVGSETCVGCHRDAGDAWRSSHHAWAWRSPTEASVLGDFGNSSFEHRSAVSRFTKGGGGFFVETDGPDGSLAKYEVKYTVGVTPLQQYLVETEPGRLQQLDVTWDTERHLWYHLYPEQDLKAGNGLHWTGPYKNWNARCAECHATGFQKNYNPRSKIYASKQAEIGVGCEACHGPGEAHAAWAGNTGSFEPTRWQGADELGLTFAFDPADPEVEIQHCAGCHSRREPIGDASPPVGAPFADSYRLAVLRDGQYHPDGQILDEVYVYGSFLQSKMYAQGVRCSNCHDVHSGELKAAGNAVCTQCHSEVGNSEFPTLRRAVYDGLEHHFHESGTPAAQCVNCHMPERLYMVVDGRRDHSFRVPRPDLSTVISVPNACTDCHVDRKAAWAADQVKAWYPDGRSGQPHYGQVIARARGGMDNTVQDQLVALALSPDQPGIVRATALTLLASTPTAAVADRTAAFLEDPDPLVRNAAIRVQSAASPPVRAQRIVPRLSDEMRSVRVEAARILLDIPVARYPPAITRSVRAAMREYQASLMAKADFPEAQLAIGGTALALRNLRAAEQAFGEAAAMDPQRGDAWMMVARLQAQRGALEEARATLEQAVAANPSDGVLHQSLGNILVMTGKNSEAVVPLEAAALLMPDDATIAADLGVVLSKLGEHKRAVDALQTVMGSSAETADTLYALVVSFVALGDLTAAEPIAGRLEADYPASPLGRQARQLIGRR
ncbi:MAG: tetratricopeptide repeat protein [Alphaproteobacteria bacterium]|nr:tetratricopeptide repeat protein [Alphaproteobacteria bacterium]